MKKKEVVIGIFLIFCLIGWTWFGFFYLPYRQQIITRTGIVTDKYTEVKVGSTIYNIEIDNNTVIGLTRSAWMDYELDDSYTWSEIVWKW